MIFPKIKITKRSYELELLYEIFINNNKLPHCATLNDYFIKLLKSKLLTVFDSKELLNSQSALFIANLFLIILRYEKIFPERKWFMKFYMTFFKDFDLISVKSAANLELKLHLLQYITQLISSKVFVFGKEEFNLKLLFKSDGFFELLIGM